MKITWCMVPEIWSATYKLFCHFGSFFSKSKFWKNTWIYYHFTNYDNMIYGSWDMEGDRQNFVFISGFFALLLPNDLKNQNYDLKITTCKKGLEISSSETSVPKIVITWCTVPEIWCAMDGRTEGQTDGRTVEKVTYRDGWPI